MNLKKITTTAALMLAAISIAHASQLDDMKNLKPARWIPTGIEVAGGEMYIDVANTHLVDGVSDGWMTFVRHGDALPAEGPGWHLVEKCTEHLAKNSKTGEWEPIHQGSLLTQMYDHLCLLTR